MTTLAISTTVILLLIAFVHGLWGLRVWWPVSDEQALARTVVGAPDITKMPSAVACFAVTVALLIACVLTLMIGDVINIAWLPDWMTALGGFGATTVFLGRGVVGFLPFWARITPEQPFRRNDTLVYSPLCIAIGLAMLVLSVNYVGLMG